MSKCLVLVVLNRGCFISSLVVARRKNRNVWCFRDKAHFSDRVGTPCASISLIASDAVCVAGCRAFGIGRYRVSMGEPVGIYALENDAMELVLNLVVIQEVMA